VKLLGPNWLTNCPFIDYVGHTESEYEVIDGNGRSYHFVGIMAHLIEVHGFFEGRGTEYRVDPDELINFFHLNENPPIRQKK